MIVDIHSHSQNQELNHITIRNIGFNEADQVFKSNCTGHFSIGIHPWFAEEYSKEKMNFMDKYMNDPRFIAIGECGLDKISTISIEQQIELFKLHVQLSEKHQKPIIIHCVGLFNELLNIKRTTKARQPWIIHGFRGKPQLAKQLLNAGCALSYGVLFNIESVKITPLESLFIETDESTQAIESIYKHISKIKKCEISDLNAGYRLVNSLHDKTGTQNL